MEVRCERIASIARTVRARQALTGEFRSKAPESTRHRFSTIGGRGVRGRRAGLAAEEEGAVAVGEETEVVREGVIVDGAPVAANKG